MKIVLSNIISRIISVALVSLPLAWFAFSSDQEIKNTAVNLSREELIAQVTSMMVNSVDEAFLMIFAFGVVLVGVTEAIALGLRWLFNQLSRKPIA